jgi:hypothetical protein
MTLGRRVETTDGHSAAEPRPNGSPQKKAKKATQSASRSDEATVAVCFSPRCAARMGRVAQRRMNCQAVLSSVATRRSLVTAAIRGLKPTATFAGSLRDLLEVAMYAL